MHDTGQLLASSHNVERGELTGSDVLDLSHNEHTILTDNFSEHDVLAIEERCRFSRDEELTSVRVGTRVGLLASHTRSAFETENETGTRINLPYSIIRPDRE
jgi:hypothetical protein